MAGAGRGGRGRRAGSMEHMGTGVGHGMDHVGSETECMVLVMDRMGSGLEHLGQITGSVSSGVEHMFASMVFGLKQMATPIDRVGQTIKCMGSDVERMGPAIKHTVPTLSSWAWPWVAVAVSALTMPSRRSLATLEEVSQVPLVELEAMPLGWPGRPARYL